MALSKGRAPNLSISAMVAATDRAAADNATRVQRDALGLVPPPQEWPIGPAPIAPIIKDPEQNAAAPPARSLDALAVDLYELLNPQPYAEIRVSKHECIRIARHMLRQHALTLSANSFE